MFDLELHQKGFDRALQSLANYNQVATQENKKAMNQVVNLVVREGKIGAPVGVVGELRAKIHGEVREAGPGAVVGVVGSYAKHGAAVEKGAEPHWPNIRNLGLWVLRKVRVSRKDLAKTTYLIARTISRRGTRAQPYLEPAFENNKAKISGFFQNALERIVRRLAG